MGYNVVGGALVVSFAINGITVMRLFALYERSKKVLFALLSVVTVTVAMQLYGTALMTQAVINSAFFPSLDLNLPGCFSSEPVAYGIFLWASYLSCSVILFGFMMVKFFRVSYQRTPHKMRLVASPTIVAFYRSGTMWFFCLTAIIVVHACSLHNLAGPLRSYTIPWITVVQSVLGSRLVLNLHVDQPDQKTDLSTRLGRLWFENATGDDEETTSTY